MGEAESGLTVEEQEVLDAAAGKSAGGADEPEGLTEDILYAGHHKPASSSETLGDAAPDLDKPDDEDKPKPEAKVEPKPAEKPAEGKPAWDLDRQRRDEEHAAERRAFQERLQEATASNAALVEQLQALREERSGQATAQENRELEEALAEVDSLHDQSEPSEITAALKTLKRIVLTTPRGGVDAARVEKIEQGVETLAANLQAMSEAQAVRQGRDDVDVVLAELDKEFDPKLHNDALEKAGQYLLAQGRTMENPPTLAEKKIALRLAYVELSASKPGPKPKPRPSIAADAGSGGGLQAAGMKRGSNAEVLAAMRREGKIR